MTNEPTPPPFPLDEPSEGEKRVFLGLSDGEVMRRLQEGQTNPNSPHAGKVGVLAWEANRRRLLGSKPFPGPATEPYPGPSAFEEQPPSRPAAASALPAFPPAKFADVVPTDADLEHATATLGRQVNAMPPDERESYVGEVATRVGLDLAKLEREYDGDAEYPAAPSAELAERIRLTKAYGQAVQAARKRIEAPTEAVEPPAVKPGQAAVRPGGVPLDVNTLPAEEPLHRDARRFAKLLVSEIELCNKVKVAEGRKNRNLYIRLKSDIDRSRQTYQRRFPGLQALAIDYFDAELLKLADGDPGMLGLGKFEAEPGTTLSDRALTWIFYCGLLLLAGFSLGILLWVNRYRFDHVDFQNGESFPVRVHRVTGEAEVLYQGAWQPARLLKGLARPIQSLSPEDLLQLKAQAKLDSDGGLELELYNGSDFVLKEFTVEVQVSDSSGKVVVRRLYRLEPALQHHLPQESHSYWTAMGFYLGPQQSWSWNIAAAKGVKY